MKALEEIREILSRTVPELNLANSNLRELYTVAFHVKVSAVHNLDDLRVIRHFIRSHINEKL